MIPSATLTPVFVSSEDLTCTIVGGVYTGYAFVDGIGAGGGGEAETLVVDAGAVGDFSVGASGETAEGSTGETRGMSMVASIIERFAESLTDFRRVSPTNPTGSGSASARTFLPRPR